MLFPFSVLTLAIFLSSLTHAQFSDVSLVCSSKNNRLDPTSHKLLTDCDDKTYCSAVFNGTCLPRLCRRDEYPFGFSPGDPIPPQCPLGAFCPDEGSGCLSLAPVGSPCQLNRDDQCAPPKDWQGLSNHQNFNGSLCLYSSCVFANATLGERCMADQTTYVDLSPNGEQFNFTVTRHNCRTPILFCDPNILRCVKTRPLGAICSSDQECQTLNCDSGLCWEPPEMPTKVEMWQWIATIGSVVCAMVAIVVTLVMIHKRIRHKSYEEIHEYYEEQLSLRRSIFALQTAAADRADSHVDVNEKSMLLGWKDNIRTD